MPELELGDVTLHYEEAGEGPPLVLSHGVIENTRSWARVVPLLAQRYRTIAYDLRGRGRSSGGPVSFPALVEDLSRLARRLDAVPFLHVGHSMAGRLTLEHAAAHPEEVRAIACVSGRPDPPAPKLRARLARVAERARREGTTAIMDFWFPTSHPLAAEATAISAANSAEGTAAAIECSGLSESFVSRLGEVRAPILVVVGDGDAPFLDGARLLAERVPGAELHVLEGVGHFPNLEAPERLAGLLDAFFSAILVRSPSL